MSTQKSVDDPYKEALRARLQSLKSCQSATNVSIEHEGEYHGSCMPCPKIIGCETRRLYVAAVYNSMGKGDTGGFDF